jgi:hypothetical protein
MNWNFRATIIATSKIPMDWMEQGEFMVYHVIYFAKTNNNPPCLFEYINQTRQGYMWYLLLEREDGKVKEPNIFKCLV